MRPCDVAALKLTGDWSTDHLCHNEQSEASLAALIAATAFADAPSSLAIGALNQLSIELIAFAELFANGGTDLVPDILHTQLCAMSKRAEAFAELSRRIDAANQEAEAANV